MSSSARQAIRARWMKVRVSPDERDKLRVLPIRVGDGELPGILFNTIVPDVRARNPEDTATLILNRLGLIVPAADLESGRMESHRESISDRMRQLGEELRRARQQRSE